MFDALRSKSSRNLVRDLILGKKIEVRISPTSKSVEYYVGDRKISDMELKELLSSGILLGDQKESLIACPLDGSYNLNVVLTCPVHRRPLTKIEIYEDMATGSIVHGGSENTALRRPAARGYFLRCEAGETVVNPAYSFRCEKGHLFSLQDALVVSVQKYRLNEKAINKLNKYFEIVNAVSDVLREHSYQVSEDERKVKGLSGTEYEFDVKASQRSQNVLVYITEGERLEEVLSLLPKLYDIAQAGDMPLLFVIVTSKQFNQDLLRIFDRYNARAIVSDDLNEIKEYLDKSLK
ncbi:MAG: hypothetical protein ACP5LW_05475 [Nitrososphaeria archaeon]